jgi:hypothetical protein
MKEPRRLREQPQSDLERALLNAGATYRGSPRTRVRVLAALGLTGSLTGSIAGSTTAVGATAVGAGASSGAGASAGAGAGPGASMTGATGATISGGASLGLSAKLWVTTSLAKLVAGVALLGAVASVPVGVAVWQRQRAPVQMGGPGPAAGDMAGAPTIAVERAMDLAPESPPAPVARSEKEPARPTRSPRPAVVVSPALRRELAALDAARRALASGNARSALTGLDAYDRAYPRGRLELEAEVLRIDALAKAGLASAARRHAEAFVRRHPGSVFASRVRSTLNE